MYADAEPGDSYILSVAGLAGIFEVVGEVVAQGSSDLPLIRRHLNFFVDVGKREHTVDGR